MKRPLPRALTGAALALPLLLALPACGGAADPKSLTDDGMAALNSGDYEGAAATLEAALEAMKDDPSNVNAKRATLGLVEAKIRIDAGAAKDRFLAYAKANTSTVTPDDYSSIGRAFASAGAFSEAIDILDAGMKTHAESPVLHKLAENIKTAAEKAGDSGALTKMAGLGYL